jgi:hypothetical protein
LNPLVGEGPNANTDLFAPKEPVSYESQAAARRSQHDQQYGQGANSYQDQHPKAFNFDAYDYTPRYRPVTQETACSVPVDYVYPPETQQTNYIDYEAQRAAKQLEGGSEHYFIELLAEHNKNNRDSFEEFTNDDSGFYDNCAPAFQNDPNVSQEASQLTPIEPVDAPINHDQQSTTFSGPVNSPASQTNAPLNNTVQSNNVPSSNVQSNNVKSNNVQSNNVQGNKVQNNNAPRNTSTGTANSGASHAPARPNNVLQSSPTPVNPAPVNPGTPHVNANARPNNVPQSNAAPINHGASHFNDNAGPKNVSQSNATALNPTTSRTNANIRPSNILQSNAAPINYGTPHSYATAHPSNVLQSNAAPANQGTLYANVNVHPNMVLPSNAGPANQATPSVNTSVVPSNATPVKPSASGANARPNKVTKSKARPANQGLSRSNVSAFNNLQSDAGPVNPSASQANTGPNNNLHSNAFDSSAHVQNLLRSKSRTASKDTPVNRNSSGNGSAKAKIRAPRSAGTPLNAKQRLASISSNIPPIDERARRNVPPVPIWPQQDGSSSSAQYESPYMNAPSNVNAPTNFNAPINFNAPPNSNGQPNFGGPSNFNAPSNFNHSVDPNFNSYTPGHQTPNTSHAHQLTNQVQPAMATQGESNQLPAHLLRLATNPGGFNLDLLARYPPEDLSEMFNRYDQFKTNSQIEQEQTYLPRIPIPEKPFEKDFPPPPFDPQAQVPTPIYPAFAGHFVDGESAKKWRKRTRVPAKVAIDIARVKKHGRRFWTKRIYEAIIDQSYIRDQGDSIHARRFRDEKGFDPMDLEATAHHVFDSAIAVHEKGWTHPDIYHKKVQRGKLLDTCGDLIENRLEHVCALLRTCKATVDDAIRGGVTLSLLTDNPQARSATKSSNNKGNKERGKRLREQKKLAGEKAAQEAAGNGETDQHE